MKPIGDNEGYGSRIRDWIVIILISITITLLTVVMLTKSFFDNPKATCDIGEEGVLGDFKSSSSSYFSNRQCAIKDCGAYNKYIGGTGCVV